MASEGSKVLYYLGMYKIHNTIKEIINSIWIAPTVCPCCNGTGYLNDGRNCPQCKTYGYSGFNATKGIQIDKGYDVRITRQKFDTYPLTNAQYEKVWKFVNKAWTQKWWVTPTISEIKRMFAHFYNVDINDIIITERFHFSMPQWNILLPILGLSSPFTLGDRSLMKFIAESVTPAGVNVFVGFYQGFEDLFGVEDDSAWIVQGDQHIISKHIFESSIDVIHHAWGQRFRMWNGWCDCIDDFEDPVFKPAWNVSGNVSLFNANDLNRHVVKFQGNSQIQRSVPPGGTSGVMQIWIHPVSGIMQFGLTVSGYSGFVDYIQYDRTNRSFTTEFGTYLRSGYEDCDYHLTYEYNILMGPQKIETKYYINRELFATGLVDLSPWWGIAPTVRVRHVGAGIGYADAFGLTAVAPYQRDDNWQRLYPAGWGRDHLDTVSGVSNLFEKYFIKDKPFFV